MKKSPTVKEASNILIDDEQKDNLNINLSNKYLNQSNLTNTIINNNNSTELKNKKATEAKNIKRFTKSVKVHNNPKVTKKSINELNSMIKKIIFPNASIYTPRITKPKETKIISNNNINQQRLSLNSEKYIANNNTLNKTYTSNFYEINIAAAKNLKNHRNQNIVKNSSLFNINDNSKNSYNEKTIHKRNESSDLKNENLSTVSTEKHKVIKLHKTKTKSSIDIFKNDNSNNKLNKTLYLFKPSKKSTTIIPSSKDNSSLSNHVNYFRYHRQYTINLDTIILNNQSLGIILEKEKKEINHHYLENTICAKNKIVKKYKNDNIIEKEYNFCTFKKININNKKAKCDGGRYSLQENVNKNSRINLFQSDEKTNKNKNQSKNKISNEKYNNNPRHSTNRATSSDMTIPNITTMSNTHIFNGKIEDYLITKELGRGSYAIVKLATHKITKQKYAIKIYTKELLLDPQKRNIVKNETIVLKNLNHNNIMKLYEVIDTPNNLYLVLEYINGLSLLDVINKESNKFIEQNRAIKLFFQIVNGIAYCHSKNIAHRDIKLENILVLKDDIIKIIDFGFSIKTNKETFHKLFCGTPSYMPPEIRNKEKYIAQYCDIWSLGVLFYAMLYGKFPFKDDDEIIDDNINIEFPDKINLDERVKNLFKKIFVFEPKNRVSPDEIINEMKLNGLV